MTGEAVAEPLRQVFAGRWGAAMSFRRKGKAANNWREWIADHRETLSRCGLPEVVYSDPVAWENFLVDGFLPDGCGVWSGWHVEMLSADQVRRFYAFLDHACAGHPFQGSMKNLLRRLFRLEPEG